MGLFSLGAFLIFSWLIVLITLSNIRYSLTFAIFAVFAAMIIKFQ